MNQTLLVIAGEDSGDLHGAELLRELKARRPGLRIVGVGGPRMTPLLDRKLADVKDLAVVGFIEVIRHLPRLNRLFKQILALPPRKASRPPCSSTIRASTCASPRPCGSSSPP